MFGHGSEIDRESGPSSARRPPQEQEFNWLMGTTGTEPGLRKGGAARSLFAHTLCGGSGRRKGGHAGLTRHARPARRQMAGPQDRRGVLRECLRKPAGVSSAQCCFLGAGGPGTAHHSVSEQRGQRGRTARVGGRGWRTPGCGGSGCRCLQGNSSCGTGPERRGSRGPVRRRPLCPAPRGCR